MRPDFRTSLERASWVTSVRTRREDRSLHRRLILSQTSAGKLSLSYVIDNLLASCCSFVRAWRPFLRPGLQVQRRAARKGPSRLAVAMTLRLAPVFPGHALTGLSTARGSSRSGRCCIGLDALEGTAVVENRPGDAGELVGERDRQHVVVQPLFGGLDPGLEAIAFPLLWARP